MKTTLLIKIVLAGGLATGAAYYALSVDAPPTNKKSAEVLSVGLSGVATKASKLPKLIPSKLKDVDSVKAALKASSPKENLLYTETKDDTCQAKSGQSIYVRYLTSYPDNKGGLPNVLFTDAVMSPSGKPGDQIRSPEITDEVYRDDHKWSRHNYTVWWHGSDQEYIKQKKVELEQLQNQLVAMQEEMQLESSAAGMVSSEQLMLMTKLTSEVSMLNMEIMNPSVEALNETVFDKVEVFNPMPYKSFRYNNVEKYGYTFDYDVINKKDLEGIEKHFQRMDRGTLSETANELNKVLSSLEDFSHKIVKTGQRQVLSYSCDVQSVSEWDTELCSHEIAGYDVPLWIKTDALQKEAIYIVTDPCVPDGQFIQPSDIQFDELNVGKTDG